MPDSAHRRRPKGPAALAELVHLPGRRALIVVQPQVFTRLHGVSMIPLTDGRALLAFDQGGGLAELEVAILDKLEVAPARSAERAQLIQVRDIVRARRRDSRLVFRTKSIIVVEGLAGVERRPLATLAALDTKTRATIVEGRNGVSEAAVRDEVPEKMMQGGRDAGDRRARGG